MTCETCWGDAYVRMLTRGGVQADHYRDLLRERADNPCTPAMQQAHPLDRLASWEADHG